MNVTGFLGRNNLRGWAVLNPRVALAEKRLMDAHVKEHPACEVCGEHRRSHVDVHHCVSLWSDTSQAGTEPSARFITLCNHRAYNHHLLHGHMGNFAQRYTLRPYMICAALREVLRASEVVRRDDNVVEETH